MIVYDSDDLDVESIPDAAETDEHFGTSGIHERFEFSRLPSGKLLVKPPVLSVLLDAKIRGLKPYPVWIR